MTSVQVVLTTVLVQRRILNAGSVEDPEINVHSLNTVAEYLLGGLQLKFHSHFHP